MVDGKRTIKPLSNPVTSKGGRLDAVKKGGGVILLARFNLGDLGLSRAQLMRASRAAANLMGKPVRSMVNNKYALGNALKKRGGGPPLQIISGKLIGQAKNKFRIAAKVKSLKKIEIVISWGGVVNYFFFQMFGTKFIPARPFVELSQKLLDDMEKILETQIRKIVSRRAPIEEKAERAVRRAKVRRPAARRISRRELGLARRDIRRARADAVAIAAAKQLVAAAGRRPTKFKIRKALRRGGLPPTEARRIAREFGAVIQTGLLSPTAIGLAGSRLQEPETQAVIRSTIAFQALLQGRIRQ